MTRQNLGPCILEGEFVRLEPVRAKHVDGLWEAARKMEWGWMLVPLRSRKAVELRVSNGIRNERGNEEFVFAVTLKSQSRIVGSTSYLAVSTRHRRAEIGATWYLPEMWGTAVNPECKLLLLKHAFEDWGAVRIQFTTDEKNVHSQHALTRLGAKFEGKLRNHGIREDDSARDALVYSIIASEWPQVKRDFVARLKEFEVRSVRPSH